MVLVLKLYTHFQTRENGSKTIHFGAALASKLTLPSTPLVSVLFVCSALLLFR